MTAPVSPSAPVAWRGPGTHPHDYHPDIMAMGDCSVCGHTYEAHQPVAASPAPSMVGLREKVMEEMSAGLGSNPSQASYERAVDRVLALLAREGV